MVKKRDEMPPWWRRISIRRIISFFSLLIILIIAFSFFGLISAIIIGPIPSGNIAVIHIDGRITGDDMAYISGTSSTRTVQLIKSADSNKEIKAILFEINSGGGSPVASDEIASAIKSTKKPTVAVIREVGASGAYWIATSTDKIYANRMSITGSIGVIGDYLEFAKLIEDYNITYRLFTSGKYKGMGSPFKELTDEESVLFQEIVDKTQSFFVDAVAENRNLPVEKVSELATGQVYLGIDAIELGLIDELGSKEDAIKYLEKELNITADLADYKMKKTWYDTLSSSINKNSLSELSTISLKT